MRNIGESAGRIWKTVTIFEISGVGLIHQEKASTEVDPPKYFIHFDYPFAPPFFCLKFSARECVKSLKKAFPVKIKATWRSVLWSLPMPAQIYKIPYNFHKQLNEMYRRCSVSSSILRLDQFSC